MKDLVLLHGALGASGQFNTLAETLRPRFRIHQIDFEGHGAVAPCGRPFRIQHFVANVVELLDRLALEQAAFFGYSMGGYVALCLGLGHPDRVDRVTTLGTKFRWDPAHAAREVARLDPSLIQSKVPSFAAALEARHARAGGWRGVLAGTAELIGHLGDHPLLTDSTLPGIAAPVRVIVGDRDNTVTVEESSAVARSLASGSLTVLPDTPHPIEQVDVEVLAPVLTEFFDQ
jgi:pimeloyl-ACP methyl ester carboxylesterase